VKKPDVSKTLTPSAEQSLVERALQVARAASDTKAVDDLRERLSELSPAPEWTRSDAIRILAAVADFVGEIMDTALAESGGMLIVREHSTTNVLRQLGTALADLDQGKIDERLKHNTEKKRGAAYTALERQKILSLLVAVASIRGAKKLTWPVAEKQLAASLSRRGFMFRGKLIRAKNLKNWRRAPPGKRK
jgi:hypothetical protein